MLPSINTILFIVADTEVIAKGTQKVTNLKEADQAICRHFPSADLTGSFLANRRFSSGVWSGPRKRYVGITLL